MSGALNNLKTDRDGTASRVAVEKALIRTATESGNGWNGTFAMVTVGLMFIARAIIDLGIAVRMLARATERRGRG